MATFHTVSLNRGVDGTRYSDFTTSSGTVGAVFTPSGDITLVVGDGLGLTKKDVNLILQGFTRFFENAQQVGPAGFDVAL